MDNRSLVRISAACSIAGILLIYGISLLVEPKGISVNLLERHKGRIVRVTGTIVDLRRHEAGHIFIKLKDESGTCEVPLFKDLAKKMTPLSIGDRLQVIGTVEEYRDSQQVVPRTERDLTILESPPVPIKAAKEMVGETVKLIGIAYKIRDLESAQEFYLTDGDASIRVSFYAHGIVKAGYNITLSGMVKTDKGETYFAAREILDLSPDGVEPVKISDLKRMDGIFSLQGSLRVGESGPGIDDGTGMIDLDENLLIGGIVEGDLIEAIVQRKGDEMNVLEVELDKANILPLERLSDEMVGRTVRIRGTVISKFVSGKNTFLTLYNGTEVEVPLFGTGQDFNVQLGDILTISGRVGVYREKLQVVPRNLTNTGIEPPQIVDKDLDDLSMNDLYSMARIRGRVSSINRYSKSCSMWIKGETRKIRVYLTFNPDSNISVGTEIEVIGLVKSYKDELEIVPRGKEDLG